MTENMMHRRPSDKLIPWYIVLFFVAQTVLFAWFTYIAEKTYTGVVTDQAYEKGLAYNRTIEKAAAQEVLGFTPVISQGGGKITFTITDHNANKITVTNAKGLLFRPVHDGVDMPFDMTCEKDLCTVSLTPPEKGLWEVRIEAMTDKGPYQASKRMTFE